MPVHSGLDALPELRQVAPDARVIVYSGFADKDPSPKTCSRSALRAI